MTLERLAGAAKALKGENRVAPAALLRQREEGGQTVTPSPPALTLWAGAYRLA